MTEPILQRASFAVRVAASITLMLPAALVLLGIGARNGVASSFPTPDWVAAGYGDSLTGPWSNKWCGSIDPPRTCDYTHAAAGEKTLPGSNRLLADLAAGNVIMPGTHYVTLAWGANEVRTSVWDVTTSFIDPLRAVITAVRAHGMEPILNVTQPQYETAESGYSPCTPLRINYRIEEVMKPAIEALALEFDPPLRIVDLWTAYMAVPEPDRCALYEDHVHQTPEGYEFMADQYELIMDDAYSPAPIVVNNGLAPPSPENAIDDTTHMSDSVLVRNAGCPPGWPAGNVDDPCPSPGAATEVVLMDGGEVLFLSAWDSSRLTMTGGTVEGDLYAFHSSTVTVVGGGVRGVLLAADSSSIWIVGSDFAVDGNPVVYGALAAQAGILTGTLLSGEPIESAFCQGGCVDSTAQGSFTGTITAVRPGDANGDTIADGADYTIWADNHGTERSGFRDGDFNCDGIVDGADYTIWADNFGAGTGAGSGAGSGQGELASELPACGLGFELLLAMPLILRLQRRQRLA